MPAGPTAGETVRPRSGLRHLRRLHQQIVGEAHRSRQDYTASENEEELAAGIAAEPDALGFFGIGAYHRHWDELKLLAIDSGKGPVYPTLKTVSEAHYQPLTRPLFIYLSERSLQEKPTTRAFVSITCKACRPGSTSPVSCRCARALRAEPAKSRVVQRSAGGGSSGHSVRTAEPVHCGHDHPRRLTRRAIAVGSQLFHRSTYHGPSHCPPHPGFH